MVTAKVVGLPETVWELGSFAGIAPKEYGGIHGIREVLLMPDKENYSILLLVHPADNPSLFGKGETAPHAVPARRLGKADANKWADSFNGRTIMAVAYLEAKPGTNGTIHVRFRPEPLDEDAPAEPGEPSAGERKVEPASSPEIDAPTPAVPAGPVRTTTGHGCVVEFDGVELRARGTNKATHFYLAGPGHTGDVVIPANSIEAVELKDTGRLTNGNVVIRTIEGQRYQLHFLRKSQADFQALAADIEGRRDASG